MRCNSRTGRKKSGSPLPIKEKRKSDEKEIREKIAPFRDVDIIFTSALTKQRLLKALEYGSRKALSSH